MRLSNSFTSARGSRAIYTYWRPTSFSRANGTVGVEVPAATPGRAGDNVFSIFPPISPNPVQNCARKRVGWKRQDPPRPSVADILNRFRARVRTSQPRRHVMDSNRPDYAKELLLRLRPFRVGRNRLTGLVERLLLRQAGGGMLVGADSERLVSAPRNRGQCKPSK